MHIVIAPAVAFLSFLIVAIADLLIGTATEAKGLAFKLMGVPIIAVGLVNFACPHEAAQGMVIPLIIYGVLHFILPILRQLSPEQSVTNC